MADIPVSDAPPDAQSVSAKGVKTTKMDLSRDFNINGQAYSKGKGVEVNKEHVSALRELEDGAVKFIDWATTHHGAVPAPNDPMEATAQTPTRPLGGEHVRVPVTVQPATNDGPAERVADPNEGKEAATEAAKGAEVVSGASTN